MNDIHAALSAAAQLQQKAAFEEVGNAALELLEVPAAIAALREAGNTSRVLTLETLRNVEDRHLLAGYILALHEQEYDTAEVCMHWRGYMHVEVCTYFPWMHCICMI